MDNISEIAIQDWKDNLLRVTKAYKSETENMNVQEKLTNK